MSCHFHGDRQRIGSGHGAASLAFNSATSAMSVAALLQRRRFKHAFAAKTQLRLAARRIALVEGGQIHSYRRPLAPDHGFLITQNNGAERRASSKCSYDTTLCITH